MTDRKVAFYIRLSIEDKKTGSFSIETQEKIISDKMKTLTEYANSEVLKFIDNGFSGTNFERPALTKMLELVQKGEISCILIKDFSRLGRDIGKSGSLIDSVFPMYYTRLISVTDYYDSNDYYEDTGGIEVAFKCMMAEQYSFDLSRKVSSAVAILQKKGEYQSKTGFYGYKMTEDREIVIDEAVADNVRFIYQLAIEGKSISQIRDILYENNIQTIGEYFTSKGNNKYYSSRSGGIWNPSSLRRVLREERYIGTYVGGIWKVKAVGSNQCILKPESEWVKIENHHPAIIDKEVFDKVQKIFPKRSITKKNTLSYPLKGQIICGVCHHAITIYKEGSQIYKCVNSPLQKVDCGKCTVKKDLFLHSITEKLKEQAKEVLERKEDESSVISEKYQSSGKSKNQLMKQKLTLFEKFNREEIDLPMFKEEKEKIDRILEKEEMILKSSEKKNKEDFKRKEEFEDIHAIAREILEVDTLTVILGKKTIKNVTIFPDKTAIIEYVSEKFSKPTKIKLN